MRILLSNDDGYLAKGLLELYLSLSEIAEVAVFAPSHNQSGTSNSLTLQRPLTIHKIDDGPQNGFYVIDGTPTDCVHIALTGYLGIYQTWWYLALIKGRIWQKMSFIPAQ